MAGFTGAILLLVGLAFASAQNCGNVLEGTIMPNANNCNSYYVCNAGILTSYTCPANYGYSSATQTCSPTFSCTNQISEDPYYPNNSPYYGNNNSPYYGNNNSPYYGNNNGYPYYGNNQPYWNGATWVYPNNVNNANNNVNWIYPTNVDNNNYPNYGYPSYSYPSYPYPYAASGSSSTADSTSPCFNVADGSYVPSSASCSQFFFCSQGQAIASNCPSGYGFSTTQNSCVASTSCTA